MPKSDAEADAALNRQRTAITYVSLHSADPGATGASEIAAGGGGNPYARKSIAATSGWSAISTVLGNRLMDNAAIVDWGVVSWIATVTHFGIWSAASGGSFLRGGALTSGAVAVASGDSVSFAVGELNVTER